MVRKRIYPPNLNELLNDYANSDNNRIIAEYNRLYDKEIDLIVENIESSVDNNLKNFEEHNYLLSSVLQPFLTHKIKDYDLLFVDPLYHCKKLEEIEDIPTFDFLLGQKQDNFIKTLIFGEVKGQSPKSDFNIDIIDKYKNDPSIKNTLFGYIKSMDASIEISTDLNLEFVLVCKGIDTLEFKESIIKKKIPFVLWSIVTDHFTNTYRVIIDENLIDLKDNNLMHNSRYLPEYFRSNRIEYKPVLEFTYSLDTNSIIFRIRDDYISKYGKEITKKNLTEIIFELGLGDYYDDSRIIQNLIEKIIKKGLVLKTIKSTGEYLFFKKISIKEKIVDYQLKRKIQEKNKGYNILQQSIANLKPQRKGILRFVNKK